MEKKETTPINRDKNEPPRSVALRLNHRQWKILLNIAHNGAQTKYDLEKAKDENLRVCKAYVYDAIKELKDAGLVTPKIDGKIRAGKPRTVYALTLFGFYVTLAKVDRKDCLKVAENWADKLDDFLLKSMRDVVEKLGREQAEDFLKHSFFINYYDAPESFTASLVSRYFNACMQEYFVNIYDDENLGDDPVEARFSKRQADLLRSIERSEDFLGKLGVYQSLLGDVESSGLNLVTFENLEAVLDMLRPVWKAKYKGKLEEYPKIDGSSLYEIFEGMLKKKRDLAEMAESKQRFENLLSLIKEKSQFKSCIVDFAEEKLKKAAKEMEWAKLIKQQFEQDSKKITMASLK